MAELSPSEALDSMAGHFLTYWKANAGAANVFDPGLVPGVEWPNQPEPDTKLSQGNKPWLRFEPKFLAGAQKSFGETSNRVFDRAGNLIIQVFVPVNKRGLDGALKLVKVASDAFEGKVTSENVRFFDVSPQTVGNTKDGWYQMNVSMRFEYDEIK